MHILLWISAFLLVTALFWIAGSSLVRGQATLTAQRGKPGAGPLVGLTLDIAGRNKRLLFAFGLALLAIRGVVAWIYRHDGIREAMRNNRLTAVAVPFWREDLRQLLEWRVLEAASNVIHVWLGFALTVSLLAIIRGTPMSAYAVASEVRKRWHQTLLFSIVVAFGPFCLDTFADLLFHSRGLGFISLGWDFSLGLGAPVLAAESGHGFSTVRRAWSLMGKAWWPRFVGALIIVVPFVAVWTLLFLATRTSSAPGAHELISSLFWLVFVPSWPIRRVFDLCLYLSLVEDRSVPPLPAASLGAPGLADA